MNKTAIVKRVARVFTRLGLIKHPYGREYAREHLTLTGRIVNERETGDSEATSEHTAVDSRATKSNQTRSGGSTSDD